jgi:hypothetical protein
VTIERSTRHSCRRVRACALSIAVAVSLGLGVEQAAAQTAVVEPEVQIGEARAVERPAPAAPTQSHEVTGVAVAGIAIARPAPVASPISSGSSASNAAAIAVGGVGAVALLAGSWQLVRRRRYDLLG